MMHFEQLLYLSAGSVLSAAEDYWRREGEGEKRWLWSPSCCRHQGLCTTCVLEARRTDTCTFPHSVGIAVLAAPEDTLPSSLELRFAQEQCRPCVIISSQKIPSLCCMPSKPLGVFLIHIHTSFSSFKFWASALCCATNVLTWRNICVCPRIIILSFGGYFI